jgi:PadR family transcriptional regulator, regulatory protein AphA
MARENTSRYAILGILTWGAMSGYDIKKWIEQSISSFWSESYGNIYPILKGLVEEGWATMSIQPQDGKPDRHVYTITEDGRSALRAWLDRPIEYQTARSELMLKLFFANRSSLGSSIEHVQRHRQRQVEMLQKCDEIEQWIHNAMPGHPDMDYWLITVNYGRHAARAGIAWCDETLETLTKRREREET